MPRVKAFATFALYLYAREKHRVAHIHIEAPDVRATLAIETGELLIGKPRSDMVAEARTYIAENRANLLARWKELNS